MDKPREILPQVLQDLDKQALTVRRAIEIIIRQGGELKDLWHQNKELQKKIDELEKARKRPVAPFA